MKLTTYLGPPGCGKTETLIGKVMEAILSGISPEKIAYVSFTNAAVDVAIKRTGRNPDELPYFRTIHSMCFRLCGIMPASVMQRSHYRELGDQLGIEITGGLNKMRTVEDLCQGDKALAVIELSRSRKEEIKNAWESSDLDLDWLLVDLLNRVLIRYKESNYLIDYTGMLERYIAEGPVPDLDIIIIDEAQDLSPLQWDVIWRLSSNCKEIILAGDDDQLIYQWAGARTSTFLEIIRRGEIFILDQSWRLPQKIHQFSQRLISEVEDRIKKEFKPRDSEGFIDHRVSLDDIDMSSGEWSILVRNRYMATTVIDHCRREGYYYQGFQDSPDRWESLQGALIWEDLRRGRAVDPNDCIRMIKLLKNNQETVKNGIQRLKRSSRIRIQMSDLIEDLGLTENRPWFEVLNIPSSESDYLRAALRRGEHVRKTPRILIDTIHGAKGSERENVVLFSDISFRTAEASWSDPDPERRVFYVGATRAKDSLFIIQPQTEYYFNLD